MEYSVYDTIKSGPMSQEEAAMRLMEMIAYAEGKTILPTSGVDREWILTTYAQCLAVVCGAKKQRTIPL